MTVPPEKEVPDEPIRRALENPADPGAFADLAVWLRPVVRSTLRSFRQWALDPEDVYQHSLRKLWEAARSGSVQRFESAGQLLAYFRTLVRNTVLDALRKKSPRRDCSLPEQDAAELLADAAGAASREPEPSEQMEAEELQRALESALRLLPDDLMRVVQMRLEGRPFEEIGAALGISRPLAHHRFQEALAALRNSLKARGYE
jgi:RNA polymerase sigma factor (sigma-70 family)